MQVSVPAFYRIGGFRHPAPCGIDRREAICQRGHRPFLGLEKYFRNFFRPLGRTSTIKKARKNARFAGAACGPFLFPCLGEAARASRRTMQTAHELLRRPLAAEAVAIAWQLLAVVPGPSAVDQRCDGFILPRALTPSTRAGNMRVPKALRGIQEIDRCFS
jgi:hypothetical protein